MKDDLEIYFGELASSLPTEEKDAFRFSKQTFPPMPDRLETRALIVEKDFRAWGNISRADRLLFHADKATFRRLGSLILSVVFRGAKCGVHLALTNDHSVIKNVEIEYAGSTKRAFGHRTVPADFLYHPAPVEKHPWATTSLSAFDFPVFGLSNLKQFVVTEEDWASRDTVFGFGNDDASVGLAQLLLDFGSPRNETDEVELEGEGGFRGVGLHSAEATFNLPGSFRWKATFDSSE